MIIYRSRNIFVFIAFIIPVMLFAQQEGTVKKSEIIETIDGKPYYMHFIKQGETLSEISKAYSVSIEDIQSNNPASKSGIKSGQILKIPVSNTKINQPETKKGDYFQHSVKNKETLYGIARSYGADINELRDANPGLGDSVKEGQTINIPVKYKNNVSSETKAETKKHSVKAGETFYSISKLYDVPVDEIQAANQDVESLKTGQVLIIPPKGSQQPTAGKTHTVAAGETLYSIARRYGISPDELRTANPDIGTTLSVGQKIAIPESGSTDSFFIYTAEKNEKLQDIADRFKVPYNELSLLNPELIKKTAKGDKVKIPVVIQKKSEPEKEVILPKSVEQKSKGCIPSLKNKEVTYNVALMLPLFLEQVDSLNLAANYSREDISKASPFKFIQFYEGFIMAVDSLKKEGFKMNLYVYDVDNSSWKVNSVLKKPELAEMDIIIGPFYSESFKKMADFALTNNIWIVNPLSTREEIVNGNPNVFKLKPAVSYQVEQLVEILVSEKPSSNIIIIRQNKYKFQEEVSYLKNYLNSHRTTTANLKNKDLLNILDSLKTDRLFTDDVIVTTEKLSRTLSETTQVSNAIAEIIISEDSLSTLRHNLSKLRNNFIIVYSEEKVFCQDLMARLNKLNEEFHITLFGAPEWKKFNDLDNQYLVNLNTHFFVPTLVDYNSANIKKWIADFRADYSTEPSMNFYAFDGFDAGWYFLNALFLYGKGFENCLPEMKIGLTQTKFSFERLKGNGFQNIWWNIGHHSDFRFIPIGR